MSRHALLGAQAAIAALPSGLTGLYGSQIVMDGLANVASGKSWLARSAMVFIAPVTSTVS